MPIKRIGKALVKRKKFPRVRAAVRKTGAYAAAAGAAGVFYGAKGVQKVGRFAGKKAAKAGKKVSAGAKKAGSAIAKSFKKKPLTRTQKAKAYASGKTKSLKKTGKEYGKRALGHVQRHKGKYAAGAAGAAGGYTLTRRRRKKRR